MSDHGTAVAPLIIPEGHSGLRSGPRPWYRTSSPVCTVARPDVAGVASGPLAVYLSRRRLLNAAPTGPSGRPKPTNVGHVCGGETSQHASGWVRPTGVGRPSCAAMTPSATSKRAAVLCFSSTRCTSERSRPSKLRAGVGGVSPGGPSLSMAATTTGQTMLQCDNHRRPRAEASR